MSDRFIIAFEELKCIVETDDGWSPSDEPYVVFVVADIQGSLDQLKLEVFHTKQFGGVQQQNVRKQHVRIWGLDGAPAAISDPDQVILLAVLMENDDSTPERVAAAARASMLSTLATALTAHGKDRAAILEEMRSGLRLSVDLGSSTGWGVVFPDDQVGPARELRITHADLKAARKGVHKLPPVVFRFAKDKDGDRDAGKYELHFTIVAAGAA